MPSEKGDQIRLPPQFLEGERAILGGILLDNDALPKVMATLAADDFYREAHRYVFQAITELFSRNEPADWLTLTAALKKEGLLETVGGVPFLTELIDAVPSAANILHYTKVVKEKSVLRQMITAANEISTRSYEDHPDIDDFLDEAEQIMFRIGESRIQSGFIHIQDLMKTSFTAIESLYERKENITGVPSGFKDLDFLTAGFQSSDLIIIAGRPSMGKTSFALNVGVHAAIEAATTTAIFSLEMSKEQIGLRILCAKAKVNLRNLRTGFLTEQDWGRLTLAVGSISDAPLFIDDTPAINILAIRAKARRLKKERNLGLVIIDYLQLMKSPSKSDSREKEISEISRSLKALAKELNVPIIALSQLNRKVEERPNKRPQLADLRESGAIEQDADVILFIYRDEVYNKSDDNPKKGEAEIIVGKQRNGPIGMMTAYFDSQYTTFRPYTSRDALPEDDSAILANI
ncbi:MAG: replicative DNA helicase [Desulfomonile sp.]|jgi:replicative DNA helicase|nr:replicative DNA helicase [Deltaproteobacteria bacterium]